MMKTTIIILALLPVLCSSCCKRIYTASTRDSTRVETRIEYIERLRDTTVYVKIPQESEKIITSDTISHLENSVAYSGAMISGGLLYHSLVNKNIPLAAKIQIKEVEVVRDSIVYRDHATTIVHRENYLTWWQKLWCTLGKIMTGIAVLYVIYRIRLYIRSLVQ